MAAERGEPFDFGVGHPGDRVFYEGVEYRVTSFNRRSGLVWLVSETDPNKVLHVNVTHLTVSWCPTSHGGTGRPEAA